MRRASVCLAVMALLGAMVPVAAASVAEAMDLEELVHEADEIVLGTVMQRRSRWEGRHIVTDVTLRVSEALEGRARPGGRLVVTHLGGEVGDVGMRVAGMPVFEDGARSLVFAKRGRRSGSLWPVGMSQGVMAVRRRGGDDVVMPGAAGLALARRTGTGKLAPAPPAVLHPRPLDEVLEEVRALVRQERGR
ncbi:MAG: hypothetical protein ACODAU_05430 [Myxococcota bacterium]